MSTRHRLHLLATTTVAVSAVALVGALRLLFPGSLGVLDDLPPGLIGRLAGSVGEHAAASAAALTALAVSAPGLLAALTEPGREMRRRVASRLDGAAARLRLVAAVAAAVMAATSPGGIIPIAGYVFAFAVLAGVVVLTALLVMHRPVTGIAVVVLIGALTVWAVLAFDAPALFAAVGAALIPVLPSLLVAVAHVAGAAGLAALALDGAAGPHGRAAVWVLRHRVAITVGAALCAAPYFVARVSWVTPWPLFAPDAAVMDADPTVRLVGMILGFGVLVGAVLTMGLVRPWGERFPSWMAGVGGRRVPRGLVVVPASLVAVLFTFGGVEFVVAAASTSPASGVTMALMLPFWLWGPLLALATWAYALRTHERGETPSAPLTRSLA
ncbi:hypothetical protein AB0N64_09125 [Microbacterium sp. NPDC089318]